jgi:hypothetical protein
VAQAARKRPKITQKPSEPEPFDPGPYPYDDLDADKFLSVPWTPELWAMGDEVPNKTPAEMAIDDLYYVDVDEAVDVFRKLEAALSTEPSCADIMESVREMSARASAFTADLLRFRGAVRTKFYEERLEELKGEAGNGFNSIVFDLDAAALARLEEEGGLSEISDRTPAGT